VVGASDDLPLTRWLGHGAALDLVYISILFLVIEFYIYPKAIRCRVLPIHSRFQVEGFYAVSLTRTPRSLL